MFTRDDIITAINGTNAASHLTELQRAIIASATQTILSNIESPREKLDARKQREQDDCRMLDLVGPAAASSAVEYALRASVANGHFSNIKSKFTNNFVANVRLVHNDVVSCDTFSDSLRQYLMPRSAYADFDTMIDPRHRVDAQCGYPRYITPTMYRYMYDRDDIGHRVVDVYPNESWALDPIVYEQEPDREPSSGFEKRWEELCRDHNLLAYMHRLDRVSGIGRFGVLLIGIDDGSDFETPIQEADLLKGLKNTKSSKERGLLYLRPFDEYLCSVDQVEGDIHHPRYGHPTMYNIVFMDMNSDSLGSSTISSSRVSRKVHWTRVIHAADNKSGSNVFGDPRQKAPFNRELDLRKIKGSFGEGIWKAGFPGLSFEVDPQFMADNPDYDREDMKEKVQKYFANLERAIFTEGVKVKTLDVQVVENPQRYIEIYTASIAAHLEMPIRVFQGSEQGKLASEQDGQTWNKRLGRRNRLYLTPDIVRATIDRFVAIGIMPPPDSKVYHAEWPPLDSPTNEAKANLSLKWTQALTQYVASGMIHLIEPMDYLTMVLGLRPSQARRIIAAVQSKGGFQKLLEVDPSQGSGVNGVRQDVASGADKKRNTADKQAEGMVSK